MLSEGFPGSKLASLISFSFFSFFSFFLLSGWYPFKSNLACTWGKGLEKYNLMYWFIDVA